MNVIQQKQSDGQGLKNLRISALADSPDAFDTTLQSALGMSDSQWQARKKRIPAFVAVVDGADAGMVCCMTNTNDSTAATHDVHVKPLCGKKVTGTALVKEAID